ncbi:MAG: alanine racemase [Alistipes sp.]|jgi:alanine racemase|nr:alanine racemase [Alistipes sp.]
MRYLLSEIATICGGELQGADRAVNHVVTDSRGGGAVDGAIFVAIRTANRDGAAYIGELYARGVRGFIVHTDFDTSPYPEAGFIVVRDTVEALQKLAAHWRGTFTGKVVGITGSTGKTTVKEWIAQLAPAGVKVFRSPKSWNSQIGVPLSVLMAAGDEDYIMIEAGISQPGEMAALSRIIRPDIAILTNIGGAHEENFASREELRAEKMILLADTPNVLVGEGDNFAQRNAALAAEFWRREGYEISPADIAALEPVAMRLEVKEGLHDSVIINDTYNSDTASLAIALDHLARVAGPRPRIVIMPAVGSGHGGLGVDNNAAALVKASGVERLIEIGPELTIDDALRTLTSRAIQGRAILIKGGARLGFDRISRALERRNHTTVLEVDLDALVANLRLCRSRLAPGVGVMPMLKAGAYGHGTFEVARTLEQQGVDYLAVAFADEGVALREAGITAPIVVLNADAGSFEAMIRHRLEPEIYNFTSLGEFTALLKRHGEQHYPVHIKLDTGMHRLGFRGGDIPELVAALQTAERYVRVATIFSHLAAADDPAQDDFTRRQIADFDRLGSAVAATLPYPVRRHIAATRGAERFPEAAFDLVRLGIGLYGIGMTGARPVASLRTRIVHIATLPAGETVGYGRCGVLTRDSIIATIPIGYADGLNRRLSLGRWSVLVGGHPAPIVGNVCMDSCMVDVTGIGDVAVGLEVVIFSDTPGNTVVDMAAALDTIPYEVLTSISERVKRIYTKE